MKRLVVALILLLTSVSLAAADSSFTRRSSQVQHDGLKQYYEIPNFRLGGRYDLDNPSKWEDGGEGGVTLESIGGGKLRTAYIAIGTPRKNSAGEITNAVVINSYYSGDSTDMYEQWVKGAKLSGGVPIVGPGRPIDTDRYYVIMVDPLGTWGASKPSRWAWRQVSPIQLFQHGTGELPPAPRQAEGFAGGAGHRRLDGRHADLCLGRDASGICSAPKRIRRSSSSSTARARSEVTMATLCNMGCGAVFA
jgi:hypothetical protein